MPIANDSAEEFVEQFTVTLSSPTNATLGTATATVSILDDDRKEWASGQRGADFNGDGLADYAVFRTTTGVWTTKINGGSSSTVTFGVQPVATHTGCEVREASPVRGSERAETHPTLL